MGWLSLLSILFLPMHLLAEPGPIPRSVKLDLDGDILPDGALARLGTKRYRDLAAEHVACSPDGKNAICWGREGVRIWNLADGKLVHAWAAPKSYEVRGVSGDGQFAVASQSAALEVWDTRSNKRTAQLVSGVWSSIRPATISPDGKLVAYADRTDYQGIWIWDIAKDTKRCFGEHKYDLNRLEFFGNGRRLLAWTPTGETSCWEVADGKLLWTDTFRGNIPLGSADGRLVIGNRQDQQSRWQLAILDVETGKAADKKINPPTRGGYSSVGALSPDGRHAVVTSDLHPGIFIWDMEKGEKVNSLVKLEYLRNLAFTPDSRHVVSASPSIRIWDAGGEMGPLGARIEDGPTEHIRGLSWSQDGTMLVARAGYRGVQYLWDARSGRLQKCVSDNSVPVQSFATSIENDHWMSFRVDLGKTPAVVVSPRNWKTGDASGTTSSIPLGVGIAMPIAMLEVADSAKVIRSVSRQYQERGIETTLIVRDTDWSSGKVVKQVTLQFSGKFQPGISADGRFLLGGGRLVDLRRLIDCPPLEPVDGRSAEFVVRTDAGTQLVATSLLQAPDPMSGQQRGLSDIAIYERATGRLIRQIGSNEQWTFAVAPNRRVLAALTMEGIVFWDIATGKELERIGYAAHGIGNRITGCGSELSFSPTGERLAVACWDGTVLIWPSPPLRRDTTKLSAAELQRLWNDLASPDAKVGWAAIYRLCDAAEQSVPFLAERVKPVKQPAQSEIDRLLADLDSPTFRTRELAMKRALEWGDSAKVVVEAALVGQTSPELKQRLELIAAQLGWQNQPIADDLRRIRALSVLEIAGSSAAKSKIDELAAGLANTRVTVEAQMAKRRLVQK